jgi:hypothetical protein
MYIRLLVRCHPCLIWPRALPTNLTYILIFLSHLPWANLRYTDILHSTYQISYPFSVAYVVYLNNPSTSEALTSSFFYDEELKSHAQPPSWRTTPCRLSATAYSVYSQPPSIYGGRLLHPQPEDAPCHGDKGPTLASPPSATWGRAMPWWQGTHLAWIFETTSKKFDFCFFYFAFLYIFHACRKVCLQTKHYWNLYWHTASE